MADPLSSWIFEHLTASEKTFSDAEANGEIVQVDCPTCGKNARINKARRLLYCPHCDRQNSVTLEELAKRMGWDPPPQQQPEVGHETTSSESTGLPRLWTGSELLSTEFPEPIWIVPGLIPAGLTWLAGAPKLGKSWLTLGMGFSVSVGGAVLGKIKVPKFGALILALEDTPRRLQSRLRKIGATPSPDLHIATDWPLGHKGIELLLEYLEKNRAIKLVVVDTWGRFSTVQDGNDYQETTRAVSALKRIADELDVAIVAVHHTRKGAADNDYIEASLGSTGLTGAADTILILQRRRGEGGATLSITGRDVQEMEYVLQFDATIGTWVLVGNKAEVQESAARQEIYDHIAAEGAQTPKQVADSLAKNHNTTKNLMRKMVDDGALIAMSGVYQVSKLIDDP